MNNASDIGSILGIFGQAFIIFWWIVLPILFYYIFKVLWVDFVTFYSPNSWHGGQSWTYLEIIPPREIERGPKMMENIFTAMTGVLSTFNTFDEYLKGAFWHDRFSAELVGEEGKMHFYIRAQKKYRPLIESHIYAQYPDAKVLEVTDYTENFPKIVPNKFWDLWGSDFEFVAKNAIPIKTYEKFEESVTGEMIDPISAIAEVIGSLGPNQHIWLQYVLQPLPEGERKKDEHMNVIKKLKGEPVVEPMSFFGHLLDVITNIPAALSAPVVFGAADKKDMAPLEFRLSPTEKDLLKATEENLGKNLFKTKMRMILIGRKENFDRTSVSSFVGAIKQFNDINFNQVKPEDISKTVGIIFFTKQRADFKKRKIYNRYRKRNMDGTNIVFSVKELATVFHFPDMSVKAPSITRTEAKLGGAPSNLPIE
jgi:hypothetical protein